MTYSLSPTEIEKVRDLIRLLDYGIDSGGDEEEPTIKLGKQEQALAARLVWDIQGFIS